VQVTIPMQVEQLKRLKNSRMMIKIIWKIGKPKKMVPGSYCWATSTWENNALIIKHQTLLVGTSADFYNNFSFFYNKMAMN
jgi:hypothetical protein